MKAKLECNLDTNEQHLTLTLSPEELNQVVTQRSIRDSVQAPFVHRAFSQAGLLASVKIRIAEPGQQSITDGSNEGKFIAETGGQGGQGRLRY